MVYLPTISKKTRDRLIFGTLALALVLILWALLPQFGDSILGRSNAAITVAFYDVGQGDAILISRGETQILVDGGPNSNVLTCLGEDMAPWDREIELVVLTHPHADHVTGLLSVLERYRVERVLYYPIRHESKRYQRFLQMIEDEEAVVWKGKTGVKINLSGIVLEVLWPRSGFYDSNVNNASIVLALSFGEFNALLLGDAEREAQIRFLPSVSDVEVLKVAHQGSKDSAYEPLLAKAKPELAVISVGAGNSYGHPHRSTLELLKRLGIEVLRTDQSGTIKVVSDGEDFWYDTER